MTLQEALTKCETNEQKVFIDNRIEANERFGREAKNLPFRSKADLLTWIDGEIQAKKDKAERKAKKYVGFDELYMHRHVKLSDCLNLAASLTMSTSEHKKLIDEEALFKELLKLRDKLVQDYKFKDINLSLKRGLVNKEEVIKYIQENF